MAQLKTTPNDANVKAFIEQVTPESKKEDCFTIMEMMQSLTGHEPQMWGPSIVGFGSYHYKYASGREGDFMRIGFSPRKQNRTLYIMNGFDRYEELMNKLGKHKTGKSCLYIKKLEDVDVNVLKQLMTESLTYMAKKYPE